MSSTLRIVSAKLTVGEIKIERDFMSRFVAPLRDLVPGFPDLLLLPNGAILRGERVFDLVEYARGRGNLANLMAMRFARSNSLLVGR